MQHSMFSGNVLRSCVCLCTAWMTLASAQLPCTDYGLEQQCLEDPGNCQSTVRCMVEDYGCVCGSQTPTDVIMILDGNNNTNLDDVFLKLRFGIAEVVEFNLPIDTHLGILIYANTVKTELNLTHSASLDKTEWAEIARQMEAFTDDLNAAIGEAVAVALDMFDTQGRAEADKVIILVASQPPTCSDCTDDNDLRTNPCQLNSELATVRMSVLLGTAEYSQWTAEGRRKLLCLDTGVKHYSQEFPDFSMEVFGYQVKSTINAATCPVTVLRDNDCDQLPADVVFVFDSSKSISDVEFWTQLTWIGRMLTDSVARNDSRFAFIRFSDTSDILRNFSTDSGNHVEDYMFSQLMDHTSGDLTNTYEAVEDAITVFEAVPMEVSRQRVMILLTDGEPNPENEALCDLKQQLEGLQVLSIVAIVGDGSIADDVHCIADEWLVVADFSPQSFNLISNFVNELICYIRTTTTQTPTSTTKTPTSTTDIPTSTTETTTTETPTTETPTTETPTSSTGTPTSTTMTPTLTSTTERPTSTTETPTTTTETPTYTTKSPTTDAPTTTTPTAPTEWHSSTTEPPTSTTYTPKSTIETTLTTETETQMPTSTTTMTPLTTEWVVPNCALEKEGSFVYSSNESDRFSEIDPEFQRWGWRLTLGPLAVDQSVERYTVGGAGNCELNGARCDGRVSITRRADGEYNYLEVSYVANRNNGVRFDDYHTWFGQDSLPTLPNGKLTVASGKYFCKNSAQTDDGDLQRTFECRHPDDAFDYNLAFYFIGHSQSNGCKEPNDNGQAFCGDVFD